MHCTLRCGKGRSQLSKEIQLTRGKAAIVDDVDFLQLNQWKWRVSSRGYARRTITVFEHQNGKRKIREIYMHRLILNTPDGFLTDHINGDPLDNRRCNLRICTNAENQHNQLIRSTKSSRYKGVGWRERENRWMAKIRVNGQTIHLGYFATEEDAAVAYDKSAVLYFGEFAKLNLPDFDHDSFRPSESQRRMRAASSGFHGVWKCSTTNKWTSRIWVAPTVVHLGTFKTAEEAAHAYDEAAILYRGEKAILNFLKG